MDENQEKKAKRPRISMVRPMSAEMGDSESTKDYTARSAENAEGGEQQHYGTGYNNNRRGGYNNYGNNRQQGGYGYNNRQGGYNNNRQGGYNNNRYNNNYYNHNTESAQVAEGDAHTSAEGQEGAPQQGGYQQGGYNRQQGGYNNRQGGYNNNRQGGYNNNRQGGYNNNRQGGYNNNRQGGYNNNRQGGYQQGGYNNNRQQGGYQQGGYNNNRQGGYNNNRHQGGYNNNRNQGGYNNNRQQGGYNNNNRKQQKPQQTMRFTPRPQRVIYDMPIVDPNTEMRLNKFMANAGICSRREADELIQKGLVNVNGVPVNELGVKIKATDIVEYEGKVVTAENKCYILLNKPKDCVTTSEDPNGRKTVMDLVKGACSERIYPVGRLDRSTTGVLLLTNDGDLASNLTHPKYVKKKIYQVWTDKPITEEHMQQIADGVELDDGPIHADAISYVVPNDRKQAGIEIHSGRNRVVRRIFESLGYHVVKLDRVYFAGLTKKNLPRGRWRYLTQEEVNFLKQNSFE